MQSMLSDGESLLGGDGGHSGRYKERIKRMSALVCPQLFSFPKDFINMHEYVN